MLLVKNQKKAVCKLCKKEKRISEFYVYKTAGKLYVSNLCRECKKERVRLIYYIKRNRIIDYDAEQRKDNDDEQAEMFRVKDGIVYAKLIWYDAETGWHNDFLPIIQMDSDGECYTIVSLAKDLSTACLKSLHREFLRLQHKQGLEE